MTLLYQWLGHFYFAEQKLHWVELACGKKCKSHLYLRHFSNSQFHFRQSLTKTLQFLAKHGFPLPLLWLVVASGCQIRRHPLHHFSPVSSYNLNSILSFKIRLSRIFPSYGKDAIFVHIISYSIYDRFTIIAISFLPYLKFARI